jgi:hypothetical protein
LGEQKTDQDTGVTYSALAQTYLDCNGASQHNAFTYAGAALGVVGGVAGILCLIKACGQSVAAWWKGFKANKVDPADADPGAELADAQEAADGAAETTTTEVTEGAVVATCDVLAGVGAALGFLAVIAGVGLIVADTLEK